MRWGAEQGGEGDARGREDNALWREDARGTFRRKISALFYYWT